MPTKSLSAIAMLLIAGTARGNDLLGRPEYAPLNLARAVGYHDHERKDGTWSVGASSSLRERSGYASEMALYRAAEISKQQGHLFVQILRSEGLIGTGMMNRGNEEVSLIVKFADTDTPPSECLQRGRHPGQCYTADASKILSRLEPRIRDASRKLDSQSALAYAPSVADHSGLMRFSTLFRFDVTESGSVENCALAQTDAPAELNASACRIFTTMAHFKADKGEDGKPMRTTRTIRVVWQRSDLGGPTTMIPMTAEAAGNTSTPLAYDQTMASSAASAAPVSAKPSAPIVQVSARPSETASPSKISRSVTTSKRKGAPPVDDTVEVPLDGAL